MAPLAVFLVRTSPPQRVLSNPPLTAEICCGCDCGRRGRRDLCPCALRALAVAVAVAVNVAHSLVDAVADALAVGVGHPVAFAFVHAAAADGYPDQQR